MRKIIVGADLSVESERAVAAAVDRARRIDAEVVLVMADAIPTEPALTTSAGVTAAKTYNEAIRGSLAHDRSELALLRQRWSGRGAEISQLIVEGFADDQLPRVARELKAELIVVGSHGRTGLKRALMGSVAERTTRLADCSVLVARGAEPDGGYRKIVVGTDFSPQAKVAALRAIEMAHADARIELVHCWQPPALALGIDVPINLPWEEMLEGYSAEGDSLVATLRATTPLPINFRLVSRPPATGLVDVATELEADLVVVGSHGRRGMRRFLLGSIAEVTARHASCSTLVVR